MEKFISYLFLTVLPDEVSGKSVTPADAVKETTIIMDMIFTLSEKASFRLMNLKEKLLQENGFQSIMKGQ